MLAKTKTQAISKNIVPLSCDGILRSIRAYTLFKNRPTTMCEASFWIMIIVLKCFRVPSVMNHEEYREMTYPIHNAFLNNTLIFTSNFWPVYLTLGVSSTMKIQVLRWRTTSLYNFYLSLTALKPPFIKGEERDNFNNPKINPADLIILSYLSIITLNYKSNTLNYKDHYRLKPIIKNNGIWIISDASHVLIVNESKFNIKLYILKRI